jgi:hypothetical protein
MSERKPSSEPMVSDVIVGIVEKRRWMGETLVKEGRS